MSNLNQFSAVEELDEIARALGWDIEYRQLGKGKFFAEFTNLVSDGIQFASERFNNHLYIHCEPPDGFIGLFLPNVKAGHLEAYGQAVTDGDLVAFPTSSEMGFVSRNTICNETIFLSAIEFDVAARAIAPSVELLTPGTATIHNGDPKRLTQLKHELGLLHRKGSLDPETASNMLAKIIAWMADTPSRTSAERLTKGAAARVARSAQTLIEENFHDVIRLQDLCSHTGVSLRTLQRSFESYFQISPLNYIKVRRLNAARRDLVVADSSNESVTNIAIRNGFSHLGRFSSEYREYFGELPSETLAAK